MVGFADCNSSCKFLAKFNRCETRVNPDQALLKRFLADPATPLAIDSNPLGGALRAKLLERKDGIVQIAFEPGREFLQGNGVVQGGIVTTMLDMTAAFAVLATLSDDRTAATASLTVSPPGSISMK
jgi:acyl-coenzyme A thioesterase PaaI-like protein